MYDGQRGGEERCSRVGGRERDRGRERESLAVQHERTRRRGITRDEDRPSRMREKERGKMPEGGIRLAREGEAMHRRSDEDGDTVEVRTRTPARARARVHTYTHTHRAAHHTAAGLPPRTFGKINRIQEKSPMVCQASRSPLLSFSRIFPHLSFSPSLLPCLPLVHPPCLSRALTRARYPYLLVQQREGELACVHWRQRREVCVHARRPRTEISTRG